MEPIMQQNNKQSLMGVATLFLIVLTLFVGVKVISEFRAFKFIGSGEIPGKTIVVSGTGEVSASPDIARLFISVQEEKKTAKEAQTEATKKSDAIIAYLKTAGVDDKDVKTTNYSVYPQYDYTQGICTQFSCPPGRQVLRGYQVDQTIEVKVRDLDSVGKILEGVTTAGATNISGPNFGFDEDDKLQNDARAEAITDAKQKAEVLAKQLGVRIVGVASFSENGNYPPMYYAKDAVMGMGGAESSANTAPTLPVGENKVISNVTITYEIR
jgi:uncharacterized protein YggE